MLFNFSSFFFPPDSQSDLHSHTDSLRVVISHSFFKIIFTKQIIRQIIKIKERTLLVNWVFYWLIKIIFGYGLDAINGYAFPTLDLWVRL